jgi:gamma-glutamyltranspeptidase/glutathione hydrolase
MKIRGITWRRFMAISALGAATLGALHVYAQSSPTLSTCGKRDSAPACTAVRGDRAEGWAQQSRGEIFAQHGLVATSQPLAAQAGLQILKQGGNAIDAAVATAAALSVVEPMNVGVGGDLFVIVYVAKEHKLYALNASGMAPSGATPERFAALGYHADPANWGPGSGMPQGGILPVTVPGTVWGWEAVLKRFGTMGFKRVLAPAEAYAREGFPVSQRIASDWELPPALPLRGCCTKLDPDSVATWYIDGRPPLAGEVFRNPDLARTFRLLQDGGSAAFYRGEIAKALIAKSAAAGGTMTMADLATYQGKWVELSRTSYHGQDVYELPPPSQAWAALEMVNVLEACVPVWVPGQTLASLGPRSPQYWHLMVEAKKLAYADLVGFNADPDFVKVPTDRLLSKAHARSLCGRVDPNRASTTGPRGAAGDIGDTIVLSTADDQGNMVALVNSNFDSFGSGLTVPGYGFVLHNRGALFSLDPRSVNVIAPHKRPYNTLSAGFVMHGDQPLMSLLLMGGDMQAQGHAQVLVDIFDLGANLQMATDMARFRHSQVSNTLVLEQGLYDLVGKDLAARGHVLRAPSSAGVGGFQAIAVQPANGKPGARVYRAGSDHRKDGQAVGY